MYQKPRAAKRLYFDVIPRAVDEYLAFLDAYPRQDWKATSRQSGLAYSCRRTAGAGNSSRMKRDAKATAISFAMLLNLAAVANAEDPAVLWGFLRRYAPDASPEKHPAPRPAGRLCRAPISAISCGRQKVYRAADEVERDGARKVCPQRSDGLPEDASAEEIQTALYDVARANSALSGYDRQGRDAGAARRLERLVQHAL